MESGNFSGLVLAKEDGKVLFLNGYGFADREKKVPNTFVTRFHIASLSMQFTAAVLPLVDKGKLSLETPAREFAPGIRGAEKITVRDLLTERSGLPEYNDMLQQHQTPASLVSKMNGKELLFEPGTKFLHEEHSAYNLLPTYRGKEDGFSFCRGRRAAGVEASGLTSFEGGRRFHAPPSKKMAIG